MEYWCDLLPIVQFRDWVWLLFCGVVFVIGRLGEAEDDVGDMRMTWVQRVFLFRIMGQRKGAGRRIRRLGLIFLLLLILGGCHQNRSVVSQRIIPTKIVRSRSFWVLAASLFYLFHLRSCAASAVGARHSGNSSGFVEGEFLVLLRDILQEVNQLVNSLRRIVQGVNQLVNSLRRIVQGVYFCLLAIWVVRCRDVCRGLVLLAGIGAWVMERHLPAELCKLVSLAGVHWLTEGLQFWGRFLLLLLV